MVWEAYKKVKSNKGSAGVDQQTLEDLHEVRSKELYKIWNRLTSGSYFPLGVKRVEIPKQGGKTRPLGIPTVSDRVAQHVIKTYLEPRLEVEFLEKLLWLPAKQECTFSSKESTGKCTKIQLGN